MKTLQQRLGFYKQYSLELPCNPDEFISMLRHNIAPHRPIFPYLTKYKLHELYGEVGNKNFKVRLMHGKSAEYIHANGEYYFSGNSIFIRVIIQMNMLPIYFILVFFLAMYAWFFNMTRSNSTVLLGLTAMFTIIFTINYLVSKSKFNELQSTLNKTLAFLARKSLEK